MYFALNKKRSKLIWQIRTMENKNSFIDDEYKIKGLYTNLNKKNSIISK